MRRSAWCVVVAAILPFIMPLCLKLAPNPFFWDLPGVIAFAVLFSGVLLGFVTLLYGFGVTGVFIGVVYVPAMCIIVFLLNISLTKWTDYP